VLGEVHGPTGSINTNTEKETQVIEGWWGGVGGREPPCGKRGENRLNGGGGQKSDFLFVN